VANWVRATQRGGGERDFQKKGGKKNNRFARLHEHSEPKERGEKKTTLRIHSKRSSGPQDPERKKGQGPDCMGGNALVIKKRQKRKKSIGAQRDTWEEGGCNDCSGKGGGGQRGEKKGKAAKCLIRSETYPSKRNAVFGGGGQWLRMLGKKSEEEKTTKKIAPDNSEKEKKHALKKSPNR